MQNKVWHLLFNGILTVMGYLMQKPLVWKNSSDTIQPIAREIKRFMPFPMVLVRK